MKRIISLILALCMPLPLAACNSGEPEPEPEVPLSVTDGFVVIGDGELNEEYYASITSAVVRGFRTKYGIRLSESADTYSGSEPIESVRNEYEILVGQTNRAESLSATERLAEDEYTYGVTEDGKTVYMTWRNEEASFDCIYDFLLNCLGYDMLTGEKSDAPTPLTLGMSVTKKTSSYAPIEFGDVYKNTAAYYGSITEGSDKPKYTLAASEVKDGDIVVSPEGDDSAAGTLDAPIATLAEAKARLKNIPGDGAVTVWLRGGIYCEGTVSFDSSDRKNVRYAAYNGEDVKITGAVPVEGWREVELNGHTVWAADVGDYKIASLYRNGKTLSLTTYPAEGWLTVTEIPENIPNSSVTVGFAPEELSGITSADNSGILMQVVRLYIDEWVKVNSIDMSGGKVEITPYIQLEKGTIAKLYNIKSLLGKTPGEWYHDRDAGVIYYAPKEGEVLGEGDFYASTVNQILTLDGCEGLTFEGLTFSYSGWELSVAVQAAYDVVGAVTVNTSKSIVFRGCEFTELGGYALHVLYHSSDVTVEGCLMHRLGGGGIHIEGSNITDPTVENHDIKITDTMVRDYGNRFPSVVGILVRFAHNVEISNCEISDGYYSGISIGWRWEFLEEYPTTNITVRDNLIYDIGHDGLFVDGGGIYTLGTQPGTVISGNVIFDIDLNHGIYLDYGSQYYTCENNIVFNCRESAMHCGGAMDCTVRNNIFGLSGQYQLGGYHTFELPSCNAEGNIIITTDAPIYRNDGLGYFTDDGNIICNYSKSPVYTEYSMPAGGLKKLGNNATFADPGFADIANYDFTLTGDSATVKAGFKPWDYRKAGTLHGFVTE